MDIAVIDVDTREEVARFEVGPQRPIPLVGSNVWVPENGEVAYNVQGLHFDYDQDEVRVIAEREPLIER